MSDLLNRLAEVRELQGREPLPNPMVIAEFEPGSPPVPPYIPPAKPAPQAEDPEWDNPEVDIPVEPPPSPLVRRPAPPEPAPAGPVPTGGLERPPFQLMVMDGLAEWKGRATQLSPARQLAVRMLVLQQLQDDLEADMAEAGVKRTRRKGPGRPVLPDSQPAVPEVSHESRMTPAEPVKRRRGRPRGSLLNRA